MKKNNKGFTLIELIATITILGIIMLVAIPNIMSTSIKSKNRIYVNDATKLVSLSKYKFESDPDIETPSGLTCIKIPLSSLDQTELQKGPEGGGYDLNDSYVVIGYDNNESSPNYKTYVYYVQLRENYKSTSKGIPLVKYDDLLTKNDKNSLVKSTGWKSGPSDYSAGCTPVN